MFRKKKGLSLKKKFFKKLLLETNYWPRSLLRYYLNHIIFKSFAWEIILTFYICPTGVNVYELRFNACCRSRICVIQINKVAQIEIFFFWLGNNEYNFCLKRVESVWWRQTKSHNNYTQSFFPEKWIWILENFFQFAWQEIERFLFLDKRKKSLYKVMGTCFVHKKNGNFSQQNHEFLLLDTKKNKRLTPFW